MAVRLYIKVVEVITNVLEPDIHTFTEWNQAHTRNVAIRIIESLWLNGWKIVPRTNEIEEKVHVIHTTGICDATGGDWQI